MDKRDARRRRTCKDQRPAEEGQNLQGEDQAKCYNRHVDEGRKRTLAVVTAVLLVPRLGNLMWDGRSSAPANESFLMSALRLAERIMEVIDRKYPK